LTTSDAGAPRLHGTGAIERHLGGVLFVGAARKPEASTQINNAAPADGALWTRGSVMTASPLDRIHMSRRAFVAAAVAGGFALAGCGRSACRAAPRP